MVILISGVSCTGKTVMAQKLLEKYKIPYLSIDHVKMGVNVNSKCTKNANIFCTTSGQIVPHLTSS